jgi:hypothetical protein
LTSNRSTRDIEARATFSERDHNLIDQRDVIRLQSNCEQYALVGITCSVRLLRSERLGSSAACVEAIGWDEVIAFTGSSAVSQSVSPAPL